MLRWTTSSSGRDEHAAPLPLFAPPTHPRRRSRAPSPTPAGFTDVAKATLIGFVVMGATGYIVKLVHIPINQILVGGS